MFIPLSMSERQFQKVRHLSKENIPVAPDGHARQDDEVVSVGKFVIGCAGLVVVGCPGLVVDGAIVGARDGVLVC